MTKERRLAIEMWEQIVDALDDGKHGKYCARPIVSNIKEAFCEEHNLKWKADCWFCQYVRHDYRYRLPSRRYIAPRYNGCQKCPLYKEGKGIFEDDDCGCENTKATLWGQVCEEGNVDAAKRILELLKGETIK